jgi:hypothetical protein
MLITAESRQDQFGYYLANQFKSYSKFEAIEYAARNACQVRWIFNDAIFGSQNWLEEPTQSLSELYSQRARQIREKYDHVVLFFSGGADCTNILNAFVDNNIPLDEVVSYVNYEATGDKNNNFNGEIFNVAIPAIENVKLIQPWLRHTIIDISQMTVDFFNQPQTKFDWIYFVNHYASPNNVARKDIRLSQPHWQRMFVAGQRVGFVFGSEKPRVKGINGRYWFAFEDVIDPAVPAQSQIANHPWEFNELFYWSPDMPQIPIKQAHVIKSWLKQQTSAEHPTFYQDNDKSCVYTTVGKKICYVTLEHINWLLYPNWKPVPFQGKPPSLIFTWRDTWFFNLSDQDHAKYSWKTGLLHRWNNSPKQFKVDTKDIARGFKTMASAHYFLGS